MLLHTRQFRGLVIIFVAVSLVAFLLKTPLENIKIDYKALLGANLLLFVLSAVSLLLHVKALANANPQAFIRSVMLANIIKLLCLAIAAFVYMNAVGKASANTIFAGLFLYIIYSWVEKRATIQLGKSKKP